MSNEAKSEVWYNKKMQDILKTEDEELEEYLHIFKNSMSKRQKENFLKEVLAMEYPKRFNFEIKKIVDNHLDDEIKQDRENFKQVIKTLQVFSKMSVSSQILKKDTILLNFKFFWDFNPNEETFAKATKGLVLFPEIIYYMVKKK
jgi:hypothetical protein